MFTPMNTRQVAKGDRAFFAISTAAAMFTMFLVVAVLVFLSIKSWSTFSQQGLAFVTGSTWDNTTELGTFQIWPMLVGTIVVSILGLIIAVPASIAVAFFIEFMAPPKVSRVATSLIDLLAALPSVVVGIWGIFVLSPVAATWSQSLSGTLSFIPFFRNEFSNAEAKGGNVASLIIAKFGEATPEELNALMAAGVVLFVMTLIVNMIATSIVQRSERRMAS